MDKFFWDQDSDADSRNLKLYHLDRNRKFPSDVNLQIYVSFNDLGSLITSKTRLFHMHIRRFEIIRFIANYEIFTKTEIAYPLCSTIFSAVLIITIITYYVRELCQWNCLRIFSLAHIFTVSQWTADFFCCSWLNLFSSLLKVSPNSCFPNLLN